MIKTGCVYDRAAASDGVRVLVTRYWPRGVKKESVGRWFKDLGTEPALIKAWKAGKIPWERFKALYGEGLGKKEAKDALAALKALIRDSGKKPVTLLCMCKDEGRCHRIILKEMLDKGGQRGGEVGGRPLCKIEDEGH